MKLDEIYVWELSSGVVKDISSNDFIAPKKALSNAKKDSLNFFGTQRSQKLDIFFMIFLRSQRAHIFSHFAVLRKIMQWEGEKNKKK